MANLEGEGLDLLKKLYEADKPQALAIIQAGEGGAARFLKNIVANAKASGIAGLALNEFKPSIDNGIDAYVAANPPEKIYEWIDAFLADEAAKLGG